MSGDCASFSYLVAGRTAVVRTRPVVRIAGLVAGSWSRSPADRSPAGCVGLAGGHHSRSRLGYHKGLTCRVYVLIESCCGGSANASW